MKEERGKNVKERGKWPALPEHVTVLFLEVDGLDAD